MKVKLREPEFDFVPFEFGLDLVTPEIRTVPGSLRESQNFEIDINGGYTSIKGYERFDGQAAPSAAQYAILDVTITGSFSAGDVITGVTSSATATVVAVVTSGAQDYLVITKITGTFNASEDLQVSAVTEGNTDASQVVGAASTPSLHAQYNNLAADSYRDDIGTVTGSGNILGVEVLGDVVYAWRNNAGGTAAVLYKSSASGWTAVALGFELAFTSGGTTEITEGQTITGATSGATATLTRVMLESGTWAGGTAAGKFIFASQTGTFQAENIDVGANPNLATIAGDSSAITLSPSGRYETVLHHFGGSNTKRIYGCDGVNRGFEFDGTVFCPIDTGMATDTPTHVCVFKEHLFFSFEGSAQHSGISTPYAWTIVTGSGELAIGDTITGFHEQPGEAGDASLAIFAQNLVRVLYGTSSSDWNLVKYRDEIGAYAYSIQEMGTTMMLDDRGIANLLTVQARGNFQYNTLSRLIQPWINERRSKINASCISRDKNQYRLFFSDDYALYITVDNRKVLGMMPVLFGHTVTCCTSREASDGSEKMYFGSDNGYVYQMDKGTSFDGDAIEVFLISHYHHSKTPRRKKNYKSAVLEITGDGYAEFTFGYELGYTDPNIPQPGTTSETINFSSSRWDSFTWDTFYWDGQTLLPSVVKLDGSAENISLTIRSNSDYFSPITFSGAQLRFLYRRSLR